jgi:hypothetical protein
MKWIFYYLKGIMNFGLCFTKNIKDVVMTRCILMKMLTKVTGMCVSKGT